MLISTELRWFYPGKLPEDIFAWFNSGNLGQTPEQREDIYLFVAPDCDYMGVKLRQGRLEVKWRKAELGTISFGNLVAGKLEKWSKWLCADETEESFQPQSVVTKSEWLRVKKVRWQRTQRDCSVEITQLEINGNTWWSLAFEAVGKEQDAIANLQSVGSKIFQDYNLHQLQVEDSFAYPSWLAIATRK
ncbi:hypothetical protein [Aliterella atlantica]|uniref:CYTH domain-containing protein n=1 Tax=Aliterella atlantica CENA595 TaxID=1618023 RepID=A0A0D8ZUE0_9CYAN|nr:hypothetical protein [Aliterella atlantica]KJH70856.1 hypothetical protein UH38_15800 [Aliterella atlantica CENA595]